MGDTNIISLKCSCGLTISPENILGSMSYCEGCHSYKVISNSYSLKPVFNKIVPFVRESRYYRQLLLDYFMEKGDAKLFNRMKLDNKLKRYYVPVREIGVGSNRIIIPLNQSNKELYTGLFGEGSLGSEQLKQSLPENKFRNMVVADHKPIYNQITEDKIEFVKIDVSMDKQDYQYQVDQNESLVIKYIPVFIFETNLCNLLCIGSDDNFIVWNEEEIMHAIHKEPKKKFNLTDLIFLGEAIVFLAVICAIVYGIYSFFTIGLSFETFIDILLKGTFFV